MAGDGTGSEAGGLDVRASAVLSALAHALNNPLGAIVLAAGLLREGPEPDVAVELASSIESEALRAAAIVGDLRALGASPTPGRTVVIDAVRLFEDAAAGTAVVTSGTRPVVEVEREKVLLVLRRLIGPEAASKVAIAAAEDGDQATIDVDLEGGSPVGADMTLARTIAELIVSEQGGSMCAENLPGGTRLRFRFPIHRPPARGRTVLVVDDNEALTSMLTLLLQRDGWSVRSTASADEASEALEDVDPAVVLVDLHLGDGSGLRVAEAVEAARPDLRGRIAIVTGDRSSDVGTRPILYKPFRWADLDALLQQLIS